MAKYHIHARDLAWEAGAYTNVPFWVMWGVYGEETAYGADVKTSSANAVGAYQFTAETKPGAKIRYPMTNRQTASIFATQAIAAGEYLYYLRRQFGTWDRALKAYNSGSPNYGYGETQIKAKAKYGGIGPIFPSDYTGLLHVAFTSNDPHLGTIPTKPPAAAATHGSDPVDHSPKVLSSGRRLSLGGTHMQAHRGGVRALRVRHARLVLPKLAPVHYRR